MRKILLLFIVLTSAFAASAQDIVTDTTKTVHTAAKKLTSAEKQANRDALDKKFSKYAKDRLVLDLNACNWLYNPNGANFNGMRTRWFSRGLNFAFMWDFRFKHSRISVAPGLEYSIYTINSRSTLVEDSATSSAHFTPVQDATNTKVNSLTLQYMDIPLELRIRTNPDKFDNMWKICIGVKAGVRINAQTKESIKETEGMKVFVERRYPEFNFVRFGPTLRVGYSVFNITAYYGVLGVFKAARGPSAHEFSLGLSFNGL